MEKVTGIEGLEPGGRILVTEEPYNAEAPLDALQRLVTPAHFVRCHFDIPHLGPDHRVEIGGAVERPLALDVASLRALGFVEEPVTLECAGNGRLGMAPLARGPAWDHGAVSTALWGGVPLSTVLGQAGVRPGAVEVVLEGADRGAVSGGGVQPFCRALPLAEAVAPGPLLALERNRCPLEPEHGAPVRLVVPGWYAMASVKWLRRITVVEQPFEGFFQNGRYVYQYGEDQPIEPVTRVRPRALVTSPHPGAVVGEGPIEVRGWAWSGAGGIARVEISLDGNAFEQAELEDSLGPHAWRRFRFLWPPLDRGRHTIRARAVDVTGAVQPDNVRPNRFGYGNDEIQTVVIEVV